MTAARFDWTQPLGLRHPVEPAGIAAWQQIGNVDQARRALADGATQSTASATAVRTTA